jgi:hypothetical protein
LSLLRRVAGIRCVGGRRGGRRRGRGLRVRSLRLRARRARRRRIARRLVVAAATGHRKQRESRENENLVHQDCLRGRSNPGFIARPSRKTCFRSGRKWGGAPTRRGRVAFGGEGRIVVQIDDLLVRNGLDLVVGADRDCGFHGASSRTRCQHERCPPTCEHKTSTRVRDEARRRREASRRCRSERHTNMLEHRERNPRRSKPIRACERFIDRLR